MGIDMSGFAFPKGVTRKVVKGRKQRAESAVSQKVRAACVLRDGDCRLQGRGFGVCGGESEWAHLEESKRARTRGMPPDVRHTSEGSLMLCTTHHRRYDAGEIKVDYLSKKGANGRLSIWCGTYVYCEPKKESTT